MYQTLAEGGKNPIVISESSGKDRDSFGGGGVLVILLFVIVIAVVAIPLMSRREPIAERGSSLSEILPAMMVMQSTSQRQTVDVNSHNAGGNGAAPSNFQLYQQGVATNDNVFVQSCATRELVTADGNTTRELINNNRMHDLEIAIAEKNAQLIAKDNQLVSERQYSSLTAQNTANYSSLQAQIYSLACSIPKDPVPAYCVSPYGGYRPGFVNTFRNDRNDRDGCNDCNR